MNKVKILVCILCVAMCCGCWDKRELEDQTFVVILGIDKAENKDVTVTVAFPLTQAEGGGKQGGSGNGGEYSVMSVKAATVVEALNLFSTKLAGPLALYSAKTVVISQELAEDDMLRHVFSSWRYEETRNNTNVLISKCKASEYIEARMENSVIDPLRQEDLLLEQSNYSAYYKAVQFLDLIMDLKSDTSADGVAMYGGIAAKNEEKSEDKGQDKAEGKAKEEGASGIKEPVKTGYLPGEVPLKADNATQICGLAVFRGNRMAGALDSSEAQTYAMMTQSKTRKILTLPDPLNPDSDIVVSILPTRKSKIRAYFIGDTPAFDIGVNLRCTIESIQSDTDYTSDENYGVLTEYIRQTCAQNMRNLVSKLQKEYNADLLKLGDKLAYKFLTVQEWQDYHWPERYPDAQISIHVDLNIDRTGFLKP